MVAKNMLRPKAYKTIKQPKDSKLCGACVAAMVVGKPLLYATSKMCATISKKDGLPYYRVREILAFIGSHGIQCGLYLVPDKSYIEGKDLVKKINISFSFSSTQAIVGVKSNTFPGAEHWVFWDGKNIRDPNPKLPETCSHKNYKIIEWTPLIYIDERGKML